MLRFFLFTLSFLIVSSLGAQDLSELYKKVDPAVVVVYTKGMEVLGGGDRKKMMASEGLGTGVVIDVEKGLVLTAAHVIQGAEEVRVLFKNGEEVPGKPIRSVPGADVALIKLSWKPFKGATEVKLGNSDDVEVGNEIFIIGTPLGLQHSLSKGVISGRHYKKSLIHDQKKIEYFQTDASINQGNSGGPMFNMKGEVIGVVSYILTQSGGFEGIGFAATSNIADYYLLQKHMFWSGIESIYVDKEIAEALNVPQQGGLLIQKVVRNSFAGSLGLRGGNFRVNFEGQQLLIGGDVITKVNGVALTSEENLEKARETFADLPSGAPIKVTVLRGGKELELTGMLPE
jgi:serine protease Do